MKDILFFDYGSEKYIELNFAIGCTNRCKYCCYLMNKTYNFNKIVHKLKEYDAIKELQIEIKKYKEELSSRIIVMSLTTDCLLNKNIELTIKFAKILILNKLKFKILTKTSNNIPYFIKEIGSYQDMIIGITITGADNLEPNVPKTKDRVKMLKSLYNKKIKCNVVIQPIQSKRFNEAFDIVKKCYKYVDLIEIGLDVNLKYDEHEIYLFMRKLDNYIDKIRFVYDNDSYDFNKIYHKYKNR